MGQILLEKEKRLVWNFFFTFLTSTYEGKISIQAFMVCMGESPVRSARGVLNRYPSSIHLSR